MNRAITTADHPQCLKLEGFGRVGRFGRFGRFDRRDRCGRVGRFDRLGKAAEADGFDGFLPSFWPKSRYVKNFFS